MSRSRSTHCAKGHPLDEANSYVDANGHRHCRACNRAKTKRRKSISVTAVTYRKLAVLCYEQDRSISGWIESLVAPFIADVPDPGPNNAPKPRSHDPGPQGPREKPEPDAEEQRAAYFTF